MIILLRSINEKDNDIYWSRALLMDILILISCAFKILKKAKDEKVKVWDILSNLKTLDSLKLHDVNSVKRFTNLYTDKKNGFIKIASNRRLDEIFVTVMNKSELLRKILEKPHAQEILSRFARLYVEVKEMVGRNGAYH